MKTILLFTALLTTATFAREPAAKPTNDACCEAMARGVLSKESLYQMDLGFTSDTGEPVKLEQLRGHSVVLAMFFASCGYACPLIVTDMQGIQAKLSDDIRDHTVFVLVSFDSQRDTPAALARYRQQRALGANWFLLHGNPDSVRELAALLGVKYKQDSDGGFSHSNLVTILNPEGEIIHQREGLNGGLDEVRTALVASLKHP